MSDSTYKAYIDNIKAKTGKTPEDFRKLAKMMGLVKYGELLNWLKSDCVLGMGTPTQSFCTYRILHSPEGKSWKTLERK